MTTTTARELVFRRGTVALVLFPNCSRRSARTRPALVIRRDDLEFGLSELIVCMITSRMFRANHPSRVSILLDSPEASQSGLLSDSVVMTDNIATIAVSASTRVVGCLCSIRRGTEARTGGGGCLKAPLHSSRYERRDVKRTRFHRHDAPGKGIGISSRCSHGL